jgi:Zn-finger nucleic acid-binding protein
MAHREGIEIDYCPNCRGVWLDKGELDKIIERSAQYEAGYRKDQGDQQRNYDSDYKKYNPYPHKKKKGFLGDFFEFD